MGLALVTKPTIEPVTLDECLAQCRITQDTENGLIAGYLLAARNYAEKVTRQTLMKQTFDWTVDFHWPFVRQENPAYFIMPFFFFRTRIELPVSPLIGVQFVKYIDANGALQTLDPSMYNVYPNEVTPFIEPIYNVDWPTTQWVPSAVQIRMDAGYGTNPSDIPENFRQAILLLVAYWYDNRGSAQFGGRGRAAGGAITSSIVPSEIPPGVDALLSLDRHLRILT